MSHETLVQPTLTDLLARYLQKQTEAQEAGIAAYDSEVHPYEVGPVQPLDPKLAWDEALAAIGSTQFQRQQAPPHWSALVANHESTVAIAFCVGNFPQLMRNFQTILTEPNLTKLRPEAGSPANAPGLSEWAEQLARQPRLPQRLLAAGVLRLAKYFEAAEAILGRQGGADTGTALENEKGALAWHRGRFDDARKIWDGLEATVPVLLNRGMAALFANDPAAAKQPLSAAIAQLPPTSAWHHLGRLYLTMAQMRLSADVRRNLYNDVTLAACVERSTQAPRVTSFLAKGPTG